MFKSSLAKGELRIIGATTLTEYKEYIGEDEALARRFRLVKVDEPSIKETREILLGLRPRLERNYSVQISDEAINTALEMAPKYIRNLHLPDKAIGWLDTAAVKVEINEPHTMIVKPEHVIDVISQESRIPRDMIFRDTTDRFALTEVQLSQRVIGQKEAIKAVAQRLRLNKGPLKESHYKPDGVLLFLGPTGRRQDRAGQSSRRVHVRRRAEDGAHRYVRVQRRHRRSREADRHAARHRRLGTRRHPD